jgi:hypothetical protein
VTTKEALSEVVWNNVGLRILFLLVLVCTTIFSATDASDSADRGSAPLLLSARRLHRLKLDAQRQTERWVNFEQRVKNVPDSPERGFELALYGSVTGKADACREAIEWGKAHTAEHRQTALIASWCRAGLSEADRKALLSAPVAVDSTHPFTSARDALFVDMVAGRASRDQVRGQWAKLLPIIQRDPRRCLPEFYALFEFLDVAQKNLRTDLREDDVHLFSVLPGIFLLSMHPADLDQPDWKTRAAGLMMVNVDPNLQGSSFVQGWAMEDPKVAREGPGVAYELLWANPYLPGLGYYNMDLWAYDSASSLLLMRKSWDANSCWASAFQGHIETVQCPLGLFDAPAKFGRLTVLPMKEQCVDIKARPNETTILSGLPPGAVISWEEQVQKLTATADAGGNVLLSSTSSGRVCKVEEKPASPAP